MTVEQVMKTNVQVCSPHDTLNTAVRIMWDHDCGVVPVVEEGKVVGMITDRDICMAAYLAGARLSDLIVASTMSRNVVTCRFDDQVGTVSGLMRTRQVRRVPVLDESDKLVGIVSLTDLAVEALQERKSRKRKALSPADVGQTLAGICAPHPGSELAAAS